MLSSFVVFCYMWELLRE